MNTDVPVTRVGLVAATLAMKSFTGIARAVSRSATSRRPVFHVVIKVKTSAATPSGSQPPRVTLSRLAPISATSISRNVVVMAAARSGGHFQRSVITTCSSIAVMTIVMDRDAVGGGQRGGRPEAQHDRDGAEHQAPVHLRHVDLAHFVMGGVRDV